VAGVGKTSAEMKTQATFTDWDFTNGTWGIDSRKNSGFPYLGWNTPDDDPGISGECGSDDGQTLTSAPANLCTTGTASAVSGNGPWSWSCAGSNGGATANCSAAVQTYALTASAAPTAGGSASCTPNPVNHGADSTCTANAASGYVFSNWSGDCTGATCTLTNVTAAKDVIASFSRRDYSVSATAGANGSVSPSGAQTAAHGATIRFSVTPASGYGIASVSGCGGSLSGNLYTTGPITDDCTVSASFSANAVSGVCGSDHGKALSSTPTNLCATGTGSGVSGSGPWSWTCGGTGGGADASCAATTSHTVDASAGTGGSISPAIRSVNHGGVTSFTVTPANGFAINSVSGCTGTLSGNLFTTGEVNATCTVSASFTSTNTTTTITGVSPSPSKIGDVVTVSYAVNNSNAGTDSVMISDQDGTTCNGTAGGGSCTLTFNSAGAKTLIARYTRQRRRTAPRPAPTTWSPTPRAWRRPASNSGVVGVPYAMQLVGQRRGRALYLQRHRPAGGLHVERERPAVRHRERGGDVQCRHHRHRRTHPELRPPTAAAVPGQPAHGRHHQPARRTGQRPLCADPRSGRRADTLCLEPRSAAACRRA
jgi:hypothetical protein